MWIGFPQVRLTRGQSMQIIVSDVMTCAGSGAVIAILAHETGWLGAVKYYGVPARDVDDDRRPPHDATSLRGPTTCCTTSTNGRRSAVR
jgi:hypothetical protein